MRLLLRHGRNDPQQDMSDYGFDGPTIENIVCFRDIYADMLWLEFETEEDRDTA